MFSKLTTPLTPGNSTTFCVAGPTDPSGLEESSPRSNDPLNPPDERGIYIPFRWIYVNPFTPQMLAQMGEYADQIANDDYKRQRDAAIESCREQLSYLQRVLSNCENHFGNGDIPLRWDFKLTPISRIPSQPGREIPNAERYAKRIPGGHRQIRVLIGPLISGGQASYGDRVVVISPGCHAMTLAHELGHIGAYCAPLANGGHSHNNDPRNIMAEGRISIEGDNVVDYQWWEAIHRARR